MNEFEKAEKLRQCADVSFEEARDALRACNGDLLDAMIYLEKLGHARKPGAASYTTDPGRRPSYEDYPRTAPKKEGPSFLSSVFRAIGRGIRASFENYLVVSHEGVVKFRISIFVFVILFLIFHMALLIAMGVSLFFGVRYRFAGKDDLSRVNRVMGRAGDYASEWWNGRRYNPEIESLCRKYDRKDQ